jgi:hypothetical protein
MTDISAVQALTSSALPSCTYNNGSSGIGATLTASSDGALTIDGYTVLLGDRVAVTQQSDATKNGIYSQTTLGDGSGRWVLTRTTDFNTPAAINAQLPFCVLNGTQNINSIWCSSAIVTAIGTNPISFAQMIQGFARTEYVGNSINYAAGNVGIRNENPEYALDVAENSIFRAGLNAEEGINLPTIQPLTDGTAAIQIGSGAIAQEQHRNRVRQSQGWARPGHLLWSDRCLHLPVAIMKYLQARLPRLAAQPRLLSIYLKLLLRRTIRSIT